MTHSLEWASVTEYLRGFAQYYPGILDWSEKVRAGVPSRQRTVFAYVRDQQVMGLAITKNAELAKLCHISVSPAVREDGIGASLMCAAILELLAAGARRAHVTTSEEVAVEYGAFFASFGFSGHSAQKSRYRRGVDELEWVASREVLYSALLSRCWSKVSERPSPSFAQLTWDSGQLCFPSHAGSSEVAVGGSLIVHPSR